MRLKELLRQSPPLKPEPRLLLPPPEYHNPVATFAVPAAHAALAKRIDELKEKERDLAAIIEDYTERLRQIRVTCAALATAFQALDDDIYTQAAKTSTIEEDTLQTE